MQKFLSLSDGTSADGGRSEWNLKMERSEMNARQGMSDEEGEKRIYFPLSWKAKLFFCSSFSIHRVRIKKFLGGTNRRGVDFER